MPDQDDDTVPEVVFDYAQVSSLVVCSFMAGYSFAIERRNRRRRGGDRRAADRGDRRGEGKRKQ